MNRPKTRITWPHGWLDAADAIRRRVRCGNLMNVWISPDGVLWIRNRSRHMKTRLPDTWLIGVFGPTTPVHVIEDSVIERMREISTTARSVAA